MQLLKAKPVSFGADRSDLTTEKA